MPWMARGPVGPRVVFSCCHVALVNTPHYVLSMLLVYSKVLEYCSHGLTRFWPVFGHSLTRTGMDHMSWMDRPLGGFACCFVALANTPTNLSLLLVCARVLYIVPIV